MTLRTKGQPPQTRWVRTSGSYLSASDPRVHFAVTAAIESLLIDDQKIKAVQSKTLVRAR